MSRYWVIFGSSSDGPGRLRVAPFDAETGELGAPRDDAPAINPSYFVLTRDGTRLYCCLSGEGYAPGSGGVAAYAVDAASGHLQELGRADAGGIETCHVALDRTETVLFCASYLGPTVAVFSLARDGSIRSRTAHHRFDTAGSVHPDRQDRSYAHAMIADPTNRYTLAADLGADRIWVFPFDATAGTLGDPVGFALEPGDGPRHMVFSPDGGTLYVSNELSNTVAAFAWADGVLTPIERCSTLPEGAIGVSYVAEILCDASGRHLYVTNRGFDSVAMLATGGGALRLEQVVPTRGGFPRNMALDPAGRWLVVTNHRGGNGLVFSVEPESGRLTQHGAPFPLADGYGVRFLARP